MAEITETTVPSDAISSATQWWNAHKRHIDQLMSSNDDGGAAFPPSGSDRYHPELWKAGHWRWLKAFHRDAARIDATIGRALHL